MIGKSIDPTYSLGVEKKLERKKGRRTVFNETSKISRIGEIFVTDIFSEDAK